MNNSVWNLRSLFLILFLIGSTKIYGQFGIASGLSESSRSSIAKLEEQIDSISNVLMIAVYDTSYSEGERLEFVVLLGEIGTEKCIGRIQVSNATELEVL